MKEVSIIFQKCAAIRENIGKVIIGKDKEINLILVALLAEGNVLLEDVPGNGKTVLAKSLAKSVELTFGRVQFTPDLLPSDLTGINFYNPKEGEFVFRKGSLFANIILADEINRATPRTQAGLLEAMEERNVTVDGTSYHLDAPYFVIATQNPVETHGTYPLPEAQLDRFLIKLSLGYPKKEESVDMLKRFANNNPYDQLNSVCNKNELIQMQQAVKKIKVHNDVLSYIVDITEATRTNERIRLGVSSRGSLALMRAGMAYAAISNRDFVTPDDIKYLVPHVYAHRVIINGRSSSQQVREILNEIVQYVPVPTEKFNH